jgi:hypothetical protein
MNLFECDEKDLGPQPTPREQLLREPNDKPTYANAFGYCIDCEKRHGSQEWKLCWCRPCRKFHTCCPQCEVPLGFHCPECGTPLLGPDGEMWCEKHSVSRGWGDDLDNHSPYGGEAR